MSSKFRIVGRFPLTLIAAAMIAGSGGCALHDRGTKVHHPSDPQQDVSSAETFVQDLDPADVVLVIEDSGNVGVFDGSLRRVPPTRDRQISTGSPLKRAIDLRTVEGSCVFWISSSGSTFAGYELPDSHPLCQGQ